MPFTLLEAFRAAYPAVLALVGVLVFGWSVLPIALTYWMDTVADMIVTGIGISRAFPDSPPEERSAFIDAQASSRVNGTPVSTSMRREIREHGLAASGPIVARMWITFRLAFALGIVTFIVIMFFLEDRQTDLGSLAGLPLAAVAIGIGGWFALKNMSRTHLPDTAAADRRFWTMYIALFVGLVLSRPLGLLVSPFDEAAAEVPFIVIVLLIQAVLGTAWQLASARRGSGTPAGD